MVSLITPSFNSSNYIQETFESIIAQTSKEWEWIIVDDGSTDNTIKLLEQYSTQYKNIKYYLRGAIEPKGACTCRNIAVKKCTGEYLIFLDTDDVLAPYCIEKRQNEILKNKHLDFLVFQMIIFNSKTDDLDLIWNLPNSQSDLERAIMLNPLMAGSSTIWKKDSFIKVGGWNESMLINQDIELHIRSICKKQKYEYRLDMPPDLYVRNNLQSISRNKIKPKIIQHSRLIYFRLITQHLNESNQFSKNKYPLSWLCQKLFSDLLCDNETEIANDVLNDGKQYELLSINKQRIMQFFVKMAKLNLNILPIIIKIKRTVSFNRKTLGKTVYKTPRARYQ